MDEPLFRKLLAPSDSFYGPLKHTIDTTRLANLSTTASRAVYLTCSRKAGGFLLTDAFCVKYFLTLFKPMGDRRYLIFSVGLITAVHEVWVEPEITLHACQA